MNFQLTAKFLACVLLLASTGAIAENTRIAKTPNNNADLGAPAGNMLTAKNERVDSLSRQDGKGSWTCPMHQEIHKHEPGKCPICKMKLEKEKTKGT